MSTNSISRNKLVFLGETGVGKSCIIHRFVNNCYDPHLQNTIGAAFWTKSLNIQDQVIQLDIWDTAGQERYKSLSPMYYRGATAIVIVYDVNDINSYYRSHEWVNSIKKSGLINNFSSFPIVFLVGNKIDLGEKYRTVNNIDIKNYAKENNFYTLDVSAKNNQNIEELFYEIAHKLCLNKIEDIELPKSDLYTILSKTSETKIKCCYKQ